MAVAVSTAAELGDRLHQRAGQQTPLSAAVVVETYPGVGDLEGHHVLELLGPHWLERIGAE